MPYFLLAFISIIVLSACSGEAAPGDELLAQPPFDKLTDSLQHQPNDAGLHYRRGQLLYRNGQAEAAGRDLRAAWNLDQQEPYALSLVTYLRNKNTDSAIAFIRQALQKLPNSIALQVGLARGYQLKGDTDKALDATNALLARYPGELDALELKAELLRNTNREAEALATLEQAYRYAPGDAGLAQELAFAYAEAGNPKTLPLADSLIRADVDQRHAEPYYFKGVYYANTGHAEDAIRQFDAAIAHNFNYLNAYINKGIVYFDQKKYPQALKTFELASTVSPRAGEPYLWIGRVQEATGNKEEAQLNYQRAYGLDKSLKENNSE